jgi:hypothetical protein
VSISLDKNYIILRKMPTAAQWYILHHPSTYGTKLRAFKIFDIYAWVHYKLAGHVLASPPCHMTAKTENAHVYCRCL